MTQYEVEFLNTITQRNVVKTSAQACGAIDIQATLVFPKDTELKAAYLS